MNTQSIQHSQEVGLATFYSKIYGLVGLGILLSALVSGVMLTIFQPSLISLLTNGRFMVLGLWLVQIALVGAASNAAAKNTPMALPFFLIYSALNGVTISMTVAFYTQDSVLTAFLSAAAVFFAMAIVGLVIKKDLSGIRKALMAALLGIILAGLINFFLRSSALSYALSVISVVIFSGLIASDNQRIKQVYHRTGGHVTNGWVISMALHLYLDFVNLFLRLLRLMGRRD